MQIQQVEAGGMLFGLMKLGLQEMGELFGLCWSLCYDLFAHIISCNAWQIWS